MTVCTPNRIEFSSCKRRRVQGAFDGGNVTSDGGVLLLREADRQLSLLQDVADQLIDDRRRDRVSHRIVHLLRQRVFGIAQGYEDQIDHNDLRHDVAFQTAVGSDRALASQPTINRFENRASKEWVVAIHEVMVKKFIASFKRAPRRLVLDFDATDDPVHGKQVNRAFHAYYDCYCFLPLYVFCGSQLLSAYLRPSNIDAAKHSWAILKLLTKRLREAWPNVEIIFRADSGFCRHRLLRWCERNGIFYVVGLARNSRLIDLGKGFMQQAEEKFELSGKKQRLFGEFSYAAGTWKNDRRVIIRAEHSSKGENPRYIVTNLPYDAQRIYDKIYCARGDMENRIKEQQLHLFADRTSAHAWLPNQVRLLLSSLAYILMDHLRRTALAGTELARAQCSTIRLKLLKIGAIVTRNTRSIRFMLSTVFPYKQLFASLAARLCVT